MALLFQSNPDQWHLREHLRPGGRASWYVSRYLGYMKQGILTLFWEAQGKKQAKPVKGLYGWGILLSEPKGDAGGRLRVPLIYIERWISATDVKNKTALPNQGPAVPANIVLNLKSWTNHPLATMPIGTNFLVTPQQLQDLCSEVMNIYPQSAFSQAVKLDTNGVALIPSQFEMKYVKEEADDDQ
jgi:hypothetical protein